MTLEKYSVKEKTLHMDCIPPLISNRDIQASVHCTKMDQYICKDLKCSPQTHQFWDSFT